MAGRAAYLDAIGVAAVHCGRHLVVDEICAGANGLERCVWWWFEALGWYRAVRERWGVVENAGTGERWAIYVGV